MYLYPVQMGVVVTTLLLLQMPLVVAQRSSTDCLYGRVSVNSIQIPRGRCEDYDPLNVGADPDVQNAMRIFGIDPSNVRFKGCEKLPFSAAIDSLAPSSSNHYVITYPSDSNSPYIAPVVHELAHVLQLEMAGGLIELRTATAFSSERVELGADYLAGFVFSRALNHLSLNEFQHSLNLIGLYVESDQNAHGTPEQRTAAFRFGAHVSPSFTDDQIRILNENFQANIYGQLAQM